MFVTESVCLFLKLTTLNLNGRSKKKKRAGNSFKGPLISNLNKINQLVQQLSYATDIKLKKYIFFSLVSFLKKKKRLIKWAAGVCVCLCVCVSVCVCVCTILVPPINFQTSYPIDTKCRLHIVSYRNSPTPLIPFLNFENCVREKFIFHHTLINQFSNMYGKCR